MNENRALRKRKTNDTLNKFKACLLNAVEMKLNWYSTCVILLVPTVPGATTFAITNIKLNAPVVTLSKLLQQLKSSF